MSNNGVIAYNFAGLDTLSGDLKSQFAKLGALADELKAQAAKYADADGDGKISDTPKASGNASKNGKPADASDQAP